MIESLELIEDICSDYELAVFMKAYLDESAKQHEAEMITIAGIVLRNRDAKIVQREWRKALRDIPRELEGEWRSLDEYQHRVGVEYNYDSGGVLADQRGLANSRVG